MAGIALRALAGVTRPAAEGPLDSPRHVRSPPSGIGSSAREISVPTSGEFRIPTENSKMQDLTRILSITEGDLSGFRGELAVEAHLAGNLTGLYPGILRGYPDPFCAFEPVTLSRCAHRPPRRAATRGRGAGSTAPRTSAASTWGRDKTGAYRHGYAPVVFSLAAYRTGWANRAPCRAHGWHATHPIPPRAAAPHRSSNRRLGRSGA
jgi:hypothetical protein